MNKPIDLVNASVRGDQTARVQLDTAIYGELRELAAKYLNREYPGHSLRPTGLVHEVFLKMVGQQNANFLGRTHFMAIAAQSMRRILVDHARKKNRQKRGGKLCRVSFDEELVISPRNDDDLLAVDDALTLLATLDPRQAKIVEMRFFAGMTVDEVADSLDLSRRTVEREWTMAKAWLRQQLSEDETE